MERAIGRYLRHHRAQNSSAATIRYHRQTLERSLVGFLRSQGHSLSLDDFGLDDVLGWIDDQQRRGLAQKTVATRVISVKAFSRWLADEEYTPKDVLKRLKTPKVDDVQKETLSLADVDALLRACDRKTHTGARDFAALMLLFSTGLRAAEVAGLTQADIDWERGLVTIRRGKGGKFRQVPMGDRVDRALTKYLSHPKRPDSPHLFVNQRGEPLAQLGLRSALRRLEDKTGIHCNPHKWRHSAAVQYLRNGGHAEHLQRVLGHSTMAMTLHYARMAGTDLADAHTGVDPVRGLKIRV